ncbi:MAG: hypothetical protein ABI640_13215, partial [Gammaproteobacteria bacterium]
AKRLSRLSVVTWEQNDIAGRPLVAPIFEGINENDLLIADVTTLNFNVTYEIGFAIGSRKRVFLIKHSGITRDEESVRRVGIFDTLGYEPYRDSDELFRKLSYPIDDTPIEMASGFDSKAPLYVLETPVRTEEMGYIISRVKKVRMNFRSFTPSEHSRLSAMEAVTHVANSLGVLVPLLQSYVVDSNIHNIRAAFVIGLAHGMQKATLLLQGGDAPVPLDVRDFVETYRHPKELDELIEKLARDVFAALQGRDELGLPETGLLASLSLGDPMAENEFQTLGSYYIETDEYRRTQRGEVNLVVGRKGTGKTALFAQVRDRLRRDRQNIVVDLKPEGYQLVKLKDDVLKYLSKGARQHLVTAFWEYLLLLEVCYKVLEKDADIHLRDHRLTEPYRQLSASYYRESVDTKGDFSERLTELSHRIATAYSSKHSASEDVHLSTGEVTELIHKEDLHKLSQQLSEYLSFKKGVWILFDNLDRGWSAHGLTADDVLMVRALIDAGRKIQRGMQRDEHDFHCVIFLRNDVYQLLMDETSDFGKEMRASLDWRDPDLLRKLVHLRLQQNPELPKDVEFDRLWREICVSHLEGVDSFQYLIDRSLMRPRNVLKILTHCRGSAVNLGHGKIEEEDIRKGLAAYSTDLLTEIDQELTDIDASANGLVYVFLREASEFSPEDIPILLELKSVPIEKMEQITQFLLYFGFLGVKIANDEPQYIHDVGYDMKILRALIAKHPVVVRFTINPACWPALSIQP